MADKAQNIFPIAPKTYDEAPIELSERLEPAINFTKAFCLAFLLSLIWPSMTLATRFHPAVNWPLGVIFLVAAVTVFLGDYYDTREFPGLSWRSFSASITIALIGFLVPTTIYFFGLRFLPPTLVVLSYATFPLWGWLFGYGRGNHRLFFLTTTLAGALLFYLGSAAANRIGLQKSILFSLVTLATLVYALGVYFMKKIFWIHIAISVNFWSLLIASVTLLGFAYVNGEFAVTATLPRAYWPALFTAGFAWGLGIYTYRHVVKLNSRLVLLTLTLGVPLLTAVWNALIWNGEMPLNFYTVAGLVVALGSLVAASQTEAPLLWLSHLLTSSSRQGDRVRCAISGFMKGEKGLQARVEVTDLSIGGLGFRSDTFYPVAEFVMVSLPLGPGWTQVNLDCRIAHITKSEKADYPWVGGVEFTKLGQEHRQLLIEFLSKLAKPVDN